MSHVDGHVIGASRLQRWKGPDILTHVSRYPENLMEHGPRLPKPEQNLFCSHEGLSFSVSIHPEVWARQLEQDPRHNVFYDEMAVVFLSLDAPALDFYRYLDGRRPQAVGVITDWAVRHGWIEEGLDYRIHNPVNYRQEHQDEVEIHGYLDAYGDDPDVDWFIEDSRKVDALPGWRFTEKLKKHLQEHYRKREIHHPCMQAEVINLWLAGAHPDFGMIWRSEPYSPSYGSAPSGAILPHHFKDVRILGSASIGDWRKALRRLSSG